MGTSHPGSMITLVYDLLTICISTYVFLLIEWWLLERPRERDDDGGAEHRDAKGEKAERACVPARMCAEVREGGEDEVDGRPRHAACQVQDDAEIPQEHDEQQCESTRCF